MKNIIADLKPILRRLARSPLFTVMTLLTLAIGVGANTAIFSVVEGVMLKPLPYPNSEQLVSVRLNAPGLKLMHFEISPSTYFILREQGRTFQEIGAYAGDGVNITGVGEPEHVQAMRVTDGVLPILDVQPILGRWFAQADDSPGGPNTVILAYLYWMHRFGGDRSVIDRNMTVDGEPKQIIGVMPQRFTFLDSGEPAVFIPFKWDRAKMHLGNYSYSGIARLKPGATLDQARADMARLLPVVLRSFPAPEGFSLALFQQANIQPDMRPLKQEVVGDVGRVLWVLMGGIGLVLMIACANVANLLLVRAEGRRQELAIRAALGAGRRRIAGELMLESLLLALAGGAIGLALAQAALRLLLAMAPAGLPRLNEIGLDAPVLLFALGASIAAGLLFGSVPVWKYAGAGLGTGLRGGGRTQSDSRERHRARNALVVVQVALALVLLIGSGLIIRTFRALTHVDPGYSAHNSIQTFRVALGESDNAHAERVIQTEHDILQKLQAIPGVSDAGISTSVPLDENHWTDPIFARDHNYAEGQMPPLRRFKFVSPGYFKAIGIPLLAGREITWDDAFSKRSVAIVSENFAREYWRDPAGALGKEIRTSSKDDWRQIVGVVGDIRDDGVDKEPPGVVYWPLLLANFESDPVSVRGFVAFVMDTPRAGSESLMNDVRRAVWSVNSSLPLSSVSTVQAMYRKSMARTSFTLVMLGLAGGMALLLGMVGLYGVVAYSVSQRRREIGIRMAVGAEPPALIGMFVRQALALAGIGAACGLAAALLLMQLMSSLLFGVKPADLVTYTAASLCLVATAAIASYVPSRRAATVNPVEALRAE